MMPALDWAYLLLMNNKRGKFDIELSGPNLYDIHNSPIAQDFKPSTPMA